MSDNKSINDAHDHSRLAGNETYEVAHLQEKLGVTKEELEEAIQSVGNSRDAIEAYFYQKKNS